MSWLLVVVVVVPVWFVFVLMRCVARWDDVCGRSQKSDVQPTTKFSNLKNRGGTCRLWPTASNAHQHDVHGVE